MTGKVIIFSLVLVTAGAAQDNTFLLGVTVGLSEHGRPQTETVRLWIDLDVKYSHPNNINKFRFLENHHGYLGLGILVLNRIVVHSRKVQLVGQVLVLDDMIQHCFRIQTPVHQLNDWLYCKL